MPYEPRRISFLGRNGRLKHYGIAVAGDAPRPSSRRPPAASPSEAVPTGAYGFTIAHDATTAGLAIVYWWANDNEIHMHAFAAPLDDPGALEPAEAPRWHAYGSSR